MNGRAFKLGTFAKPNGKPFAAIVLDDTAIDLAQAHEAYRAGGRPALASTSSLQDLLDDWDRNFATLQEIVAFSTKREPSPPRRASPASRPGLPSAAPARCSTPRRISRSTSTR
jgi:hypothetical protein